MMTKRDFFKRNEQKAFDIAERQAAGKYDSSRYRTGHIAAEAQLILEEWFDDYENEHV